MSAPWDRAAIAGIGQTEFSQNSGRSERRLAVEAVTLALADAGLTTADVDGLVTFDMDSNDPASVAAALGIGPLTFFATTSYGGGGGCATVMHAASAVAAGSAQVVVCYRAMNERSGNRFGQAKVAPGDVTPGMSFTAPYGIHTAAQTFSLAMARYFHEHGLSSLDVAPVAVAQRGYAATNPASRFFGRPITLEDHQASRWIVEPVLHLLDCCLESDGGVAIVVTSTERARTLAQPPVTVLAAAQGLTGRAMRDWSRPSIASADEIRVAGQTVWDVSGLGPSDIDVAILYDHFLPMVLMQLEALGFCGPGQAGRFVADGGLAPGGRLPVNTNGGLTGEAYLHGMNGITEAVRQLRGTAANQVDGARHALVTSGPGVPTSALILGAAS